MSLNRDKNADRAATRQLIQSKSRVVGDGSRNWLGHRLDSGAAKIDQLLLVGTSMDQLARCRGAVHEHLEHLRVEHGLDVLGTGGIYRFRLDGVPAVGASNGSRSRKVAKRRVSPTKSTKQRRPIAVAAERPLVEGTSSFNDAYVTHATRVFLDPTPKYPWCDIVSGVDVCLRGQQSQRMSAVASNTFRGFRLVDKGLPGAQRVYVDYFVQNQDRLAKLLRGIRNRNGLHTLANQIVSELRSKLKNVKPDMLQSYNRLRKPIDLYFEHLVAMAHELNEVRERLVPHLYLPLDSQILANPEILSSGELDAFGLSPKSTFGMIRDEVTYLAIQRIIDKKAAKCTHDFRREFHPIYFDLVWGNRWQSRGTNLFMTNDGGR